MLSQEVPMAVFFAQETAELANIYRSVKARTVTAAKSAAASKFLQLFFLGYCLRVTS